MRRTRCVARDEADRRHPATEAAANALQEATILVGAVRRASLAGLDDLSKVKLALDRVVAALRPERS